MNKRKRDDEEDPVVHKRPRTLKGRWGACARTLAHELRTQEAEDEMRYKLVPRSHAVALAIQVAADPLADIERRIQMLHKTWTIGFKGWHYQRVLFDNMIVMNMRWIVGEQNYERYKPLIIAKLGLPEMFSDLNFVMGRQQGKSEGGGNNNATFAIHIPQKLALLAQGERNTQQV